MTLYHKLLDAGCIVDSHDSDLYVLATPKSWAIVRKNVGSYTQVSTFVSQIDGELWFDIPFAYIPFWERKPRCSAS